MLALAATVLGLGASQGDAAITIGSDLSPDPGNAPCSGGDCTTANLALPGQQVASPFDGMVVRWRARNGNVGTPARLRVIQPQPGGLYSAVRSSLTVDLPSPGIGNWVTSTFNTQLPIRQGQLIGLDLEGSATNSIQLATNAQAGVSSALWSTPLGASAAGPSATSAAEIAFNADVEPAITTITGHPKAKVKTRRRRFKASFIFSANQAGLIAFQCRLDAGPFTECKAPKSYRVRRGRHLFQVQATDSGAGFGSVAEFGFRVKKSR